MPESGDIWERYDAKVVQIQQLEARLSALERELAAGKHERDHWARVARQLNKKLQVARDLAERLREAQHHEEPVVAPALREAGEVDELAALRAEFDRSREVLGLVLSALTRALDDDDEAVAELGRRLRHHAGGKLLHSITRGSLTLVPVDGRYLVDRPWLARLDLAALRSELDVSAQSGIYPLPENASIVHTEPPMRRPDLQDRLAQLGRVPALAGPPEPAPAEPDFATELPVDLEDELDAYADDSGDLPPPPPMPAAQLFIPPPPLLAALPAEDPAPGRATEPPRRVEDTIRASVASPKPLADAFIPNLRIGRLVKTPGGG